MPEGSNLAYVALYRKYRPQTFADVVAQDHIVRTLGNALQQNRLSHAYLLAGPRGTGKTTVARILAKAINCQKRAHNDGIEPCNNCPSCQAVTDGSDLDVLEIDAASNRGIDEIRDLREKVRYAPARSPFKVYIVDEVHMLTNEAFNAFLKTLEDPPEHCVFIFATTDPQRLPATILSRCQRFDFRQVPPKKIQQRLAQVCQAEGCSADEQALILMARHARGGMRDALALLDQAQALAAGQTISAEMVTEILGIADEETLIQLTAAALAGDTATGLQLIHQVIQAGREPRQFLRHWLEHLRNLLVLNSAGVQKGQSLIVVSSEAAAGLAQQARQFTSRQLLEAVTYLSERDQIMRWVPDGRIVLEAAWLHFMALVGGQPVDHSPSVAAPETADQGAQTAAGDSPAPEIHMADKASPSAGSEPQNIEKADHAGFSAAADKTKEPSLQLIQQHWKALCRQVYKRDQRAAVYLQKGTPTRLEGTRLTVSYEAGEYAGQRMAQVAQYRQHVAEVLRVAFKVPFELVVEAPGGGSAAHTEAKDLPAAAVEALQSSREDAPKASSGTVPAQSTEKKPRATATKAHDKGSDGNNDFVQEALRLLQAQIVSSPQPSSGHTGQRAPGGKTK